MQPNLIVKWHAATVSKSCNSIEENEDAYSPHLPNGDLAGLDFFQCAIADGATRSSFAGDFANYLVETCVQSPKIEHLNRVIRSSQQQWHQALQGKNLPWHAQEKVKEGAYATLLWLQFFPKGTNHILWNNTWRAIAIGDSCLFQFRKDAVIKAIPLGSSREFNNHPSLISSHLHSSFGKDEWETIGNWDSGDDFFLATDALAKWTYQVIENHQNPVSIFKDKLTRKSKDHFFADWIGQLRRNGEIRDDDTTLIWIKVI
jgi:hypothetical protein